MWIQLYLIKFIKNNVDVTLSQTKPIDDAILFLIYFYLQIFLEFSIFNLISKINL